MHILDAERVLQLIEVEKFTFTGGVPTLAWQLVDHPARECYDLSSLVSLWYGGAPSAPDLVRLIHQHLGAMPGNGWGMTETTGTVLSHTAEEYMRAPTSCGRPVPVAEVQIMSADGESQARSEEHTSELQSLMRISYAVFCLKKKTIVDYIINQKHNKIK